MALVVLVGVSGSGKSYFARRHFAPTQVVSSDYCRAVVSDDENDQSATVDAFDLLHHIVRTRLRRGLLTVVDATNVQPRSREQLVRIAKEHDVLTVAIVLDVPESVAMERNAARTDRDLPDHVVPRQRRELRRGLRALNREFKRAYVLGGEEIDQAVVTYEKPWPDRRHLTGPFDLIGDVHGCRAELEDLLTALGYAVERDPLGRPVGAAHPEGRTAVFLGDLVDRGPDTPGVLRLAMGMVAAGTALCVPGNHENKLVRALKGRRVTVGHGLAESLDQLANEPEEFRAEALAFMDGLVSHLVLDGGRLVVAHAGLKEAYHGRASGRVRSFALYGETTGETDEYGLPVRYPWANDYRGAAMVVYGHTPVPEPEWINNTLCVDTGCVFGGRLTALRYPEKELVAVPARQVWYEPVRPLADEATVPGTHRESGVLRVTDVQEAVETRLMGRVNVRDDNVWPALEVMSRFGVDPRWLVYLPPTMAPTPTSALDGFLEHPAEAFEAYRRQGVTRVVCEEKHMGSRAVVVVARDAATAAARFGVDDGTTGAVYTRTGRPFFPDPATTEEFLERVRTAAGGLFEELETGWLVLDCELMPWSAKAVELLRTQYAATGAAARAALPMAADVLDRAAARGLDVGALRDRVTRRSVNAELFRDAYARYCWPTEGLKGLRLAPFQVLAAEGRAHAERDHLWHLAIADRLAAADGELFAATRSYVLDLSGDESAAIAWWTELTAAGGEGMVVKPLPPDGDGGSGPTGRGADGGSVQAGPDGHGGSGPTGRGADGGSGPTGRGMDGGSVQAGLDGQRRLVQPGLKCRGREYLRIIYGPDYTEPEHLDRLRQRSLGRKRSLAMREYALGLEALDRLAAGEPLWRVHQAVFGVLALESEPVDPRL
ncbi:polynucleotide kinase-phosphatase [Actinoallomurus acanthiterrae]